MVSNIDETKPNTGLDQPVQVIRDNFAITKVEIEDLQATKVARNGDNMLGVLQLQQVATVDLPSPAANVSGILYNVDTSAFSFSNGLVWVDVGTGGDLLSSNNLSDVADSQISIDNLTPTNTVTVDILRLTDHGGNAQMWTIEEDSASPTNAITFDYAGVERIRIAPSGFVTSIGGGLFGGNVEVDQLTLTDHGSNAQAWTIEEDSDSATQNITWDYAGTERFRFSPTGVIKTADAPNSESTGLGITIQAGASNTSGSPPGIASVLGGASTNNGDGGDVIIQGGDSTNAGIAGTVFITPGDGDVGEGGTNGVVIIGLPPEDLTWPETDGSPGDVMTTDGSGILSFTAPSAPSSAFRIDVTAGPTPTPISPGDDIVILGSGSPTQVVTLPPAVAVPPGKSFTLTKGLGTTDAIIIPFGVDVIDPFGSGIEASLLAAFPVLGPSPGGFKSVTLASDGISSWFVVSTGY